MGFSGFWMSQDADECQRNPYVTLRSHVHLRLVWLCQIIRTMKRACIAVLFCLTPAVVQSQSAPRQDSSVAIIDSLRPRVIPRHVSPYTARSSSCHGFSQRKCSILGAVMFGALGYLAGDVSAPEAKYEYRGSSLGEQKICVAHCSVIPARAIVFSLSGVTIGGIGGWIVGGRFRP